MLLSSSTRSAIVSSAASRPWTHTSNLLFIVRKCEECDWEFGSQQALRQHRASSTHSSKHTYSMLWDFSSTHCFLLRLEYGVEKISQLKEVWGSDRNFSWASLYATTFSAESLSLPWLQKISWFLPRPAIKRKRICFYVDIARWCAHEKLIDLRW